jgi:2-polyprenyl-3-methyl-5-hydroxy-6-metoxy-1,4-benzoquinol methylase
MSRKAYTDFYRDVYRPLVSAYHGRRIDAVTVETDQAAYGRELAELLAPFLSKRKVERLLDVGGSTGVVAEVLADTFGVVASVLDPAPAELERASARGLTAIGGTIESFEPGKERFDLITVCQTIDHVLEIGSGLAKLRDALSPQGVLFVDIVDFRAAYLRAASVEGAVKIDHPFYLTESTMETYLARTGLRWLRKDYAADHLHVGFICEAAPAIDGALPSREHVDRLLREIRLVQNGRQ